MLAAAHRLRQTCAILVVAGATGAASLLGGAAALGQALDIPGLRSGQGIAGQDGLTDADPGAVSPDGVEPNGTGPSEPLVPDSAAPGAVPGAGTPPASPLAPDEEADPDAAPPAPRPSFDLFSGPQNTATAPLTTSGPLRPSIAAGAAGAPTGPRAGERANGAGARAGAAAPLGVRQAIAGDVTTLLPRNPPLSPGIAGETLGADSLLRSNQRVQAVGQLIRRGEDDPFAPVGIRAGSFILYPELIQTLGASNNLEEDPNGSAGVFSETTVSARLLSDWSLNEAEFNSSLTYRRNFAGDIDEEPAATADGRFRLDVDRLTTATFRGAVDYRREDPGDVADALRGSQTRPEVVNLSGSAAVAREFGRVTVTGTGAVARLAYSKLPDGALDQNVTTLTASLRTGYELSPALTPFVEASLGRRLYDVEETGGADSVERNSLIPSGRLGIALDLAEKLAGEVAVGYAVNKPDEDSVDVSGAPTLDANLVWSPRRDTDVTVTARSTFSPESSGRSTTVDYEGSLGLRHILTARTDLTATLTALYSDSDLARNDELLLTGEAGFTYWLNRYAAVTGLYSHRENFSQQSGEDYSADTIQFGIRLQR